MDSANCKSDPDPNAINMDIVKDEHVYDSLQRKNQHTGPKNAKETPQHMVSMKIFGVAVFVMFVFCVLASLASGMIVYNLMQTKGDSNDQV